MLLSTVCRSRHRGGIGCSPAIRRHHPVHFSRLCSYHTDWFAPFLSKTSEHRPSFARNVCLRFARVSLLQIVLAHCALRWIVCTHRRHGLELFHRWEAKSSEFGIRHHLSKLRPSSERND